jgi:hypothetical protein
MAIYPSTSHIFVWTGIYCCLVYAFSYWKSQAERFESRDELIKESTALLKTCRPDELDLDNLYGGYLLRPWWDSFFMSSKPLEGIIMRILKGVEVRNIMSLITELTMEIMSV